MFKVAVLISGSGSNLQALIDQQQAGNYTIVLVLSNIDTAPGINRAKQANIATQVVNHKAYETRENFEAAMISRLDEVTPDLVVLAGFMRILTPHFINHYAGRLINIHPSLLPKLKGLNTHARAIEAKETEHGASVHFVTAELDGGPVIAQGSVPLLTNDTPSTLAARVLDIEHQLYPAVVSAIAFGRVSPPPRVTIDNITAPVDLQQLLHFKG
jgi:phosphoribosylglycinamide formyltransferase-1